MVSFFTKIQLHKDPRNKQYYNSLAKPKLNNKNTFRLNNKYQDKNSPSIINSFTPFLVIDR